jgi:hypothetical protein
LTAGFNGAACDTFGGTWCAAPRNCTKLSKCVNDLKLELSSSRDRQAFFEYLDGAPAVKDEYDVAKCGSLREYFEYDRHYPDDERICGEVRDLQCLTDFSNLDGFATGSPGPDGITEQLAISTKLRLIKKGTDFLRGYRLWLNQMQLSLTFLLSISCCALSNQSEQFDGDAAKRWRDSNFALTRVLETALFVKDLIDGTSVACMTLVSAVPGTSAPCIVPLKSFAAAGQVLVFITTQALEISGMLYTEIVDQKVNANYATDVTMSMYENIITANKNLFTTFAATQQLKVMLGEISEGLDKADEEEEVRRRLQGDCFDNTAGFPQRGSCGLIRSCNDPARFCDGSFYYPFIAEQRGGESFRLPRHVVYFY